MHYHPLDWVLSEGTADEGVENSSRLACAARNAPHPSSPNRDPPINDESLLIKSPLDAGDGLFHMLPWLSPPAKGVARMDADLEGGGPPSKFGVPLSPLLSLLEDDFPCRRDSERDGLDAVPGVLKATPFSGVDASGVFTRRCLPPGDLPRD